MHRLAVNLHRDVKENYILLQVARDVYIYFLAKLSELLDTVSDMLQ